MQFERYQNLSPEERADVEIFGGFNRGGQLFAAWRSSADGEPWFKTQDAVEVEYPTIYGEGFIAEVAVDDDDEVIEMEQTFDD